MREGEKEDGHIMRICRIDTRFGNLVVVVGASFLMTVPQSSEVEAAWVGPPPYQMNTKGIRMI